MDIKVLGCSGGRSPGHELTSYLIDSCLLIDAGAAATSLSLADRVLISDVLITHGHLDHIIGLAGLYHTARAHQTAALDVYGTEPVLRLIREHLFTPALLNQEGEEILGDEIPGMNFHSVMLEIPFRVGAYEVEAFPVNHTPGSVAYRVSDSRHTLLFTGDTGRTDRIWQWLRKRGGVDCLIAEVSFPNRMQELADLSRHLTPQTLVESLEKANLDPETRIYVVHLKPALMEEVLEEIEAIKDWNLIVLREGDLIRLEPEPEERTEAKEQIELRVRNLVPEFDREADLYDQRKELSRRFGAVFKKGDIIFRQGDKSKIMYIIQEGKVRIFRSAGGIEKTLSVLGPGDFFGEMAMLNNRPRSASAEALTDLKLLAFDKNAFEKLVAENYGVALRIIRTLAMRLQEADELIENLLFLDPQSKVVNTLIQAAYGEGIETEEGFLVRITPEKLADRSGVVLSSLRGILEELVKSKLVAARKEALIIPDPRKLKRLLKFLELKNEFM